MVDLVSRKAIKKAISKAVRNNTLHYEITMVDDVMRVIDNVYSFPLEELTLSESLAYEIGKMESKPKSGVWKEKYVMPLNNDECYTEYACSECHSRFDKKTKYCPNCGSQMEGVK